MIACFGLSALADVTVSIASRVTMTINGKTAVSDHQAISIGKNSLTEDEWMLDEEIATFLRFDGYEGGGHWRLTAISGCSKSYAATWRTYDNREDTRNGVLVGVNTRSTDYELTLDVVSSVSSPISPACLYDIDDVLKQKLYVADNFQDGCYLYQHELVGVDKNAERVSIPSGVRIIPEHIFADCSKLKEVVIPSSVINLTARTFSWCPMLTTISVANVEHARLIMEGNASVRNVVLQEGVKRIGEKSFSGCDGMETIRIPSTIVELGDSAFCGCGSLRKVVFEGDAPTVGAYVFDGTPLRLESVVPEGSIGWNGKLDSELPETWCGRVIVLSGEIYDWGDDTRRVQSVSLTTTNVVINYVLNSVKPEFAFPTSSDTGFVNIVTEVKGGAIAVPSSWAEDYPTFTAKFGSDFTKALAGKTGKKDGAGNDMFVWQDYVAGTDPTKTEDKFTASITVVDGKVTVSYTPELDDARKALRKYTTWGKKSLLDEGWSEVPEGHEADYNFFKVTVEMR